MNLDDKVCYCFHISKRKIVNFIRITGPKRASQISECGGAGSGCGWCVPYLERYFAEAAGDESLAGGEELTPEEYASQRGKYIRAGHGSPPPGAVQPPGD